ncbi:DEAD/DEAH box helicase family protein [Saccharibacillus alkalitolerans]|uniref:DEAD/DEAH box helicase family protein n=1 Tax=Saccharibacillus alkalitolerans TaxID=2705290 RepID=A0ABX0F1Z2_9BACL|nr:DEAD/DEAH box helicase family protein [Saccharibacillus alkalitolerans]NGZ74991.1 DEAD/DEAH box helicase family protein [Saccharibacillus alkalitolerans]
MGFKNLNISYQYRSDQESGNIIKDFYIPVLSQTKIYKRAVGYFSSGSLMLAAKGISELIDKGGKMQLIASPRLNEKDIEAIELGYRLREDVIEDSIIRSITKPTTLLMKERFNYLAWLIANEQLDIKIAMTRNVLSYGLYHEKIGIMEDWENNKIAFSGSSNETEGGLYNNFESIDVFCNWQDGDDIRVQRKELDFEKLWGNSTSQLEIIEFPQVAKERLLSYRTSQYAERDPEIEVTHVDINKSNLNTPRMPENLEIRDYQKEAIKSWFRNECKGLLEMATGTGKTITAITAVTKLWEVTQRLAVIVVCPYTHLVDQWVKDLKKYNMSPLIAYNSRNLWEEDVNNHITAFQSGAINHFCLITTNATFSLPHMQVILRKLNKNVVFIADEAHHLGAESSRKLLIEEFPYRLALSATPNRWYDEDGTDSLLSYFGNQVVFQFGLEKAIGKYLTEYYYHPHIIYLDEDESEKYYEVTRKIVKLFPKDGNFKNDDSKGLTSLLIERARILSRARNKLIKLKELLSNRKDSLYNIVYCGDSSVDGERQIDAVSKLLGNDLDMKIHSFTSREDAIQRKELLERFETGDLQALIAIKCLDEGVDVPATQNAYILASSTNPREFIQRRGRVLRKHPQKKYSYIHDFIVLPRELDQIELIEPTLFNMERNIVKRELTRLSEFADLARNGPLAHEEIAKVKHAYNLLNF